MWKRSAWLALVVLFGAIVYALAQRQGLPSGAMQEKARTACLGCHTASIILQQQLDRRVWAREVDKMIRWGAPVALKDREALIDYLAVNFGPRPSAAAPETLPPGPGAEKVRATCLGGCHGVGPIAPQRFDRRNWAREVDKMVRWGAVVKPEDREEILNYLTTHFGPVAKTTEPEKEKR